MIIIIKIKKSNNNNNYKAIRLFNVHLPCFENSDSYVADVLACSFFIKWSFD